jgi:hypothetical protein
MFVLKWRCLSPSLSLSRSLSLSPLTCGDAAGTNAVTDPATIDASTSSSFMTMRCMCSWMLYMLVLVVYIQVCVEAFWIASPELGIYKM